MSYLLDIVCKFMHFDAAWCESVPCGCARVCGCVRWLRVNCSSEYFFRVSSVISLKLWSENSRIYHMGMICSICSIWFLCRATYIWKFCFSILNLPLTRLKLLRSIFELNFEDLKTFLSLSSSTCVYSADFVARWRFCLLCNIFIFFYFPHWGN